MTNNFHRKNVSYILETYNNESISSSKVTESNAFIFEKEYIIHDTKLNKIYQGQFQDKLRTNNGYYLNFHIDLDNFGYKNINSIIEEEKLENNLNRINVLENSVSEMIYMDDFNTRFLIYDKDILEKHHLEYHTKVTKPKSESIFPPGLSNTILSYIYKNKKGGKRKSNLKKTHNKRKKYIHKKTIKNKRKYYKK